MRLCDKLRGKGPLSVPWVGPLFAPWEGPAIGTVGAASRRDDSRLLAKAPEQHPVMQKNTD